MGNFPVDYGKTTHVSLVLTENNPGENCCGAFDTPVMQPHQAEGDFDVYLMENGVAQLHDKHLQQHVVPLGRARMGPEAGHLMYMMGMIVSYGREIQIELAF